MKSMNIKAFEKAIAENPNKLFRCDPSDEGLQLLVDYCRKTLATVGGDGYDETVLYKNEKENSYSIHTYSKYVYMKKIAHRAFSVSPAEAEDIINTVNALELEKYLESSGGLPLCGGEYVCKFLKNDKLIRVTSSDVPQNGPYTFGPVIEALSSRINPENEIVFYEEADGKEYQLMINGSAASEFFGCRPQYISGDTVKVRFPVMTDVNQSFHSDDVDLGSSTLVDNCICYSFVMPNHNVNITTKTISSMLNTGAKLVGMPQFNSMNMQQYQSAPASPQGVDKFCSFCGAARQGNVKFCTECGTKF